MTASTVARIPLVDLGPAHAELRAELDACWRDSVDTAAFVGGDRVARFEERFAGYCGRPHAVGVGNGTDALRLILEALGVGPGDEVLVPGNTFVATAEAVCATGARPCFVDVSEDTLLLDPDAAAAAVGPRTAAVIAVHLFGQMVDMDAMSALCQRAGMALVEDAAQAHGARWRGRRAGSFGVAAAFSFYPGKNLGALGDGGAVVTGDATLAATVRSLADHGRWPGSDHHHAVGSNSRLDALQAAVLDVKLDRLDAWNERRRRLHDRYLAALPADAVPVRSATHAEHVHHLEVVRVPDRDRVRADLAAAGIATGVHYPLPCHRQPAFAGDHEEVLPRCDAAAPRILSLPMYPHLDPSAVDRVVGALRQATSGPEGRS